MRLARIRARRPMNQKRRRELVILAERDVMTTEQAKRFFQKERDEDNAFLDAEHLIKCWCGQKVTVTIVRACELGWIITSKNCQITGATCPVHSETARKKLETDVASFKRRN
jgi:hypothetical protein